MVQNLEVLKKEFLQKSTRKYSNRKDIMFLKQEVPQKNS